MGSATGNLLFVDLRDHYGITQLVVAGAAHLDAEPRIAGSV